MLRISWARPHPLPEKGSRDRLNEMRKSGILTDMALCSGLSVFKCHQVVVLSSSPMFKALVQPQATQFPVVAVMEDHLQSVEKLLTFLYTGELLVSALDFPGLCKLGEILGIKFVADGIQLTKKVKAPPENPAAMATLLMPMNRQPLQQHQFKRPPEEIRLGTSGKLSRKRKPVPKNKQKASHADADPVPTSFFCNGTQNRTGIAMRIRARRRAKNISLNCSKRTTNPVAKTAQRLKKRAKENLRSYAKENSVSLFIERRKQQRKADSRKQGTDTAANSSKPEKPGTNLASKKRPKESNPQPRRAPKYKTQKTSAPQPAPAATDPSPPQCYDRPQRKANIACRALMQKVAQLGRK